MDWSKIEKDLQMQTEYLSAGRRDRVERSNISNSLLSSSQAPSLGTSRTSLYGAANTPGTRRNLYAIDDPKVNMSISSQGGLASDLQSSQVNTSANDLLNMSTFSTDISDLRSAFRHQSSKINLIELNLTNITNDAAAFKGAKDQMLERLDNVEYGLNDTRRQTGDINMGQSEITIKVKKLETSVQSIGETMQSCLTEYTTKDTFSKFMDNCFDQIKTLGLTVEAAKYKGSQAMLLFESFVHAMFDLKGVESQGFRLDFLSSLTGDIHREQVSRLLLDSLRSGIDAAVDTQLQAAVGKFNLSLSNMIKELYLKQDQAGKQIWERVKSANLENNELFEERIMKLVGDKFRAKEDYDKENISPVVESRLKGLEKEMTAMKELNERISSDNLYFRENFAVQRSLINDLIAAQQSSQSSLNVLEVVQQEHKSLSEKVEQLQTAQDGMSATVEELTRASTLKMSDVITTMKEKINAVDDIVQNNILASISSLSERVEAVDGNSKSMEESLQRSLKDNSAAAMSRIDAISTEMKSLEESTKSSNAAQRSAIASDMQSLSTSVSQLVSSAAKSNEDTMTKKLQDVQQEFYNLLRDNASGIDRLVHKTDKHEALVDMQFKYLGKDMDAKLSAGFESAANSIKSKFESMSSSQEAMHSKMSIQISNNIDMIAAIEKKVVESDNKHRASIGEMAQNLDTKLKSVNEDIANVLTQMNATTSDMRLDMERVAVSLTSKLTTHEKDLDDRIVNLKDELSSMLSEQSQTTQSSIENLQTAHEVSHRNVMEQVDTSVSELSVKVRALAHQSEETEKDVIDLYSKADSMHTELNSNIESAVMEVLAKVDNDIKGLADTVSEVERELINRVDGIVSTFSSSLTACNDKFGDISNSLNSYHAEISGIEAALTSKIESGLQNSSIQMEERLQDITTKSAEELQSLRDNISSIETDTTRAQREASDAIEACKEELSAKINEIAETCFGVLRTTSETVMQDVGQQISTHKAGTDLKISEIANDLNKRLFATAESLSDLAQQQYDLSKLHETLQERQQADWENILNELRTVRNHQREGLEIISKRVSSDLTLQSKEFHRLHEDLRYDSVQTACKVEVLEKQVLQLEESALDSANSMQNKEQLPHQQQLLQSPIQDRDDGLNLARFEHDFSSSDLITLSPWILGGKDTAPSSKGNNYNSSNNSNKGEVVAAKSTAKPQDTKLAVIESEISKLKSQLTVMTMHVDSNKENIAQLTNSISQSKIDNASNLEHATQTLIRPVAKKVDSVEASMLKSNDSLSQEALRTSQAISSLQQSLNELSSAQVKISNNSNGLSATEKEAVLASNAKLQSIENQVAELINSAVVFNAIEQKVDGLSSEVGKIRFLEQHIEALYESTAVIEDIYQKIQSLKPPADNNEEQKNSTISLELKEEFDRALRSIQDSIAVVRSDMQGQDAVVAAIRTEMDQALQHISTLTEKDFAEGSELLRVKEDLAVLRTATEEAIAEMTGLKADIVVTTQALTALDKKESELAQTVSGLLVESPSTQSKLTKAEDTLNGLEVAIETFQKELGNVTNEFGRVTARTEALDTIQVQSTSRLNDMEAQLIANRNYTEEALKTLSSELNNKTATVLQESRDSLEGRISSIEKTVSSIDGRSAEHSAQLSDLKDSVSTMDLVNKKISELAVSTAAVMHSTKVERESEVQLQREQLKLQLQTEVRSAIETLEKAMVERLSELTRLNSAAPQDNSAADLTEKVALLDAEINNIKMLASTVEETLMSKLAMVSTSETIGELAKKKAEIADEIDRLSKSSKMESIATLEKRAVELREDVRDNLHEFCDGLKSNLHGAMLAMKADISALVESISTNSNLPTPPTPAGDIAKINERIDTLMFLLVTKSESLPEKIIAQLDAKVLFTASNSHASTINMNSAITELHLLLEAIKAESVRVKKDADAWFDQLKATMEADLLKVCSDSISGADVNYALKEELLKNARVSLQEIHHSISIAIESVHGESSSSSTSSSPSSSTSEDGKEDYVLDLIRKYLLGLKDIWDDSVRKQCDSRVDSKLLQISDALLDKYDPAHDNNDFDATSSIVEAGMVSVIRSIGEMSHRVTKVEKTLVYLQQEVDTLQEELQEIGESDAKIAERVDSKTVTQGEFRPDDHRADSKGDGNCHDSLLMSAAQIPDLKSVADYSSTEKLSGLAEVESQHSIDEFSQDFATSSKGDFLMSDVYDEKSEIGQLQGGDSTKGNSILDSNVDRSFGSNPLNQKRLSGASAKKSSESVVSNPLNRSPIMLASHPSKAATVPSTIHTKEASGFVGGQAEPMKTDAHIASPAQPNVVTSGKVTSAPKENSQISVTPIKGAIKVVDTPHVPETATDETPSAVSDFKIVKMSANATTLSDQVVVPEIVTAASGVNGEKAPVQSLDKPPAINTIPQDPNANLSDSEIAVSIECSIVQSSQLQMKPTTSVKSISESPSKSTVTGQSLIGPASNSTSDTSVNKPSAHVKGEVPKKAEEQPIKSSLTEEGKPSAVSPQTGEEKKSVLLVAAENSLLPISVSEDRLEPPISANTPIALKVESKPSPSPAPLSSSASIPLGNEKANLDSASAGGTVPSPVKKLDEKTIQSAPVSTNGGETCISVDYHGTSTGDSLLLSAAKEPDLKSVSDDSSTKKLSGLAEVESQHSIDEPIHDFATSSKGDFLMSDVYDERSEISQLQGGGSTKGNSILDSNADSSFGSNPLNQKRLSGASAKKSSESVVSNPLNSAAFVPNTPTREVSSLVHGQAEAMKSDADSESKQIIGSPTQPTVLNVVSSGEVTSALEGSSHLSVTPINGAIKVVDTPHEAALSADGMTPSSESDVKALQVSAKATTLSDQVVQKKKMIATASDFDDEKAPDNPPAIHSTSKENTTTSSIAVAADSAVVISTPLHLKPTAIDPIIPQHVKNVQAVTEPTPGIVDVTSPPESPSKSTVTGRSLIAPASNTISVTSVNEPSKQIPLSAPSSGEVPKKAEELLINASVTEEGKSSAISPQTGEEKKSVLLAPIENSLRPISSSEDRLEPPISANTPVASKPSPSPAPPESPSKSTVTGRSLIAPASNTISVTSVNEPSKQIPSSAPPLSGGNPKKAEEPLINASVTEEGKSSAVFPQTGGEKKSVLSVTAENSLRPISVSEDRLQPPISANTPIALKVESKPSPSPVPPLSSSASIHLGNEIAELKITSVSSPVRKSDEKTIRSAQTGGNSFIPFEPSLEKKAIQSAGTDTMADNSIALPARPTPGTDDEIKLTVPAPDVKQAVVAIAADRVVQTAVRTSEETGKPSMHPLQSDHSSNGNYVASSKTVDLSREEPPSPVHVAVSAPALKSIEIKELSEIAVLKGSPAGSGIVEPFKNDSSVLSKEKRISTPDEPVPEAIKKESTPAFQPTQITSASIEVPISIPISNPTEKATSQASSTNEDKSAVTPKDTSSVLPVQAQPAELGKVISSTAAPSLSDTIAKAKAIEMPVKQPLAVAVDNEQKAGADSSQQEAPVPSAFALTKAKFQQQEKNSANAVSSAVKEASRSPPVMSSHPDVSVNSLPAKPSIDISVVDNVMVVHKVSPSAPAALRKGVYDDLTEEFSSSDSEEEEEDDDEDEDEDEDNNEDEGSEEQEQHGEKNDEYGDQGKLPHSTTNTASFVDKATKPSPLVPPPSSSTAVNIAMEAEKIQSSAQRNAAPAKGLFDDMTEEFSSSDDDDSDGSEDEDGDGDGDGNEGRDSDAESGGDEMSIEKSALQAKKADAKDAKGPASSQLTRDRLPTKEVASRGDEEENEDHEFEGAFSFVDHHKDAARKAVVQTGDAGPETSDNDSDGKEYAGIDRASPMNAKDEDDPTFSMPTLSTLGQRAPLQPADNTLTSPPPSSSLPSSPSPAVLSSVMQRTVTASAPPKVSGSLLSRSRPSLSASASGDSGNLTSSTITATPTTSSSSHGASSSSSSASTSSSAAGQTSPQCPFCLRRLARTEIQLHSRTCELRTELCVYGCGTQVRSSKMREHVEVCTSRFVSRDGDTTDSFDEDEDEDDEEEDEDDDDDDDDGKDEKGN